MEDQLRKSKHNSVLKNLRFEERNKQYVLDAIKNPSKRTYKGYLSKIAYLGVALASLLFLIIGGSYISPSMAKVAASIPYISQFAKEEKLKYEIMNALHEVSYDKGYTIRDLDVNIGKREISYALMGSDIDNKELKEEILKTFTATLEDKQLGSFDIKDPSKFKEQGVKWEQTELTEEDKKYIKQSEDLQKKVIEALKKNNYTTVFPVEVRVNKVQNFMYVSVPKTEKRMDELKSMLLSLSKDYGTFKMRITRIDLQARDQELRWGSTVMTIGSALKAKEQLKVRTYSYSFHPYPLQLDIKTNIHSTDSDAASIAEKIEQEVKDYIKYDENTKAIRNDKYILTVLSKDKKKIN